MRVGNGVGWECRGRKGVAGVGVRAGSGVGWQCRDGKGVAGVRLRVGSGVGWQCRGGKGVAGVGVRVGSGVGWRCRGGKGVTGVGVFNSGLVFRNYCGYKFVFQNKNCTSSLENVYWKNNRTKPAGGIICTLSTFSANLRLCFVSHLSIVKHVHIFY